MDRQIKKYWYEVPIVVCKQLLTDAPIYIRYFNCILIKDKEQIGPLMDTLVELMKRRKENV